MVLQFSSNIMYLYFMLLGFSVTTTMTACQLMILAEDESDITIDNICEQITCSQLMKGNII